MNIPQLVVRLQKIWGFARFSLNSSGNPIGIATPSGGTATLQQLVGSPINANVNLRTDTAANLSGVTGGDSELAYASDVVTIGAQANTGQLVMMGTGATHAQTFYSGTAIKQLGLAQIPSAPNTTAQLILSPIPVVIGSYSTIIAGYTIAVTGLSGNLTYVNAIGNGNTPNSSNTTLFGANNFAYSQKSTIIGNRNITGDIFTGDFIYGNDNYGGGTLGYASKGTNRLVGTTSGASPQAAVVLTLDGTAAGALLAAPAAPTVTPGAGTTGLLAGTYYTRVTYTNPYGETSASARTVTAGVTAGQQLVVTSPAASGSGSTVAVGYNVYVSTTTNQERYVGSGVVGDAGFTVTALIPTNTKYNQVQNNTSNQLHLGTQVGAIGILSMIFTIFARDTTTGTTVSRITRQVDFVSTAGALSLLSASTGSTIGTDYLGIPTLLAAAVAFSASSNIVTLTITPTVLVTDTIQWSAHVSYDFVSI